MRTSFASQCLHHETFAKYLRFSTYKTASLIHPIHDPIKEFGIVVDGCLKAEKYTFNGNELCCAYFENDDVFPEFLYFTGKKVYTYALVAPFCTQNRKAGSEESAFHDIISYDE